MLFQSLSLSPTWPHFLGILATVLSIVVGLARTIIFISVGWSDPIHCGALMNRGSWLDAARHNWQPDGCMLHSYKPEEGSICFMSKQVVFIGDSVARILFFQLAHILDPTIPTAPPDGHRHSDHIFRTKYGTPISFFWDPFLNTSRTYDMVGLTNDRTSLERHDEVQRTGLLVLGSGLWYLRYDHLSSWEANTEHILNSLARNRAKPADDVVMLPVEQVVASKLTHERAMSIRSSDIDAMNSDLFHRINPPSMDVFSTFSKPTPSIPVVLPRVFNEMLDPSQTEDGLHFSEALVKTQATILLNQRCNDVLPKHFPFDKTCCSRYPWPSPLQFIILSATPALIPSKKTGQRGLKFIWTKDTSLIFSTSIALIFLADRTGLWLKEQKHFSPWMFGFLCFISLAIGLASIKQGDKDLGFLNREQTDEWKGWMQVAILIYHYCGASKISGIYNPIRVLVASYLFMTGYGHTTFYLRKADYDFLRVAQVLVRLNVLTFCLAYTMNTDYISYYFSPLVSMWFLIIYTTMVVGSQRNGQTTFLVAKFVISACLVTWFMRDPRLLEAFFEFLRLACGIHWSAREWAFRVNLDLWIVYIGMVAAVAVIKARENRLTEHPRWPLVCKVSIGTSCLAVLWFFGFELYQESKFTYNRWHPYVSFIPILAFVVLRNANIVLRSTSSRIFAFIGRCSLETFIIQYHLWLAGDTKGILLVIPGAQWRPINFVITTIMFVYVSDRMADATTDITSRICGKASSALPTTVPALITPSTIHLPEEALRPDQRPEIIPLSNIEEPHEHGKSSETTRNIHTPWFDQLTETLPSLSPSHFFLKRTWKPGVKTRLTVGFAIMWIANICWAR
ncbi:O-acetyltransferase [Tricholoma matsutake]|nr:O-acetyltransferase [Tricholoma matsutake 945]